jgi:RNA-directed DNA polymerase
MTKGREKSDDRVVPEAHRKTGRTDASRGGKAITAREATGQLRLAFETADSPQGAVAGTGRGEPPPVPRAVPKSNDTSSMSTSPVATMEKVASRENLERAWEHVAANDGAAGPDKQSVDAMRSCIEQTLQALHDDLLAGRYRPGAIRRVWIPKSGGGQRGLGIPNVVDRIVQQAVHQVLSPLFDPFFHESSHGFRPGRTSNCPRHGDRHGRPHEWGDAFVVHGEVWLSPSEAAARRRQSRLAKTELTSRKRVLH